MRRLLVTVLAASSVLMSSCGGSGQSAVIPEDRLDAALLSLDDFDDEWTEDMRGVFTSREEGPQSLDPAGWCPKAQSDVRQLEQIEELAGDTGAAVEFQHSRRDAQRMFHGVSQQVWSNENVNEYVDVLADAFEICTGETWSPEPDQEVTISELDSPEFGDRSLAVNVDIATPGPDGPYMWKSRLVVVVVGSSLMIVRDLDVQLADSERFMTDTQWFDLVRVAVDRFAAVVGED